MREFGNAAKAYKNFKITVTGWVCSAPFAMENSTRNHRLATDRAEAVRVILAPGIPAEKLVVHAWANLHLAYVDLRQQARMLNAWEFLKRRVDIVLHAGD